MAEQYNFLAPIYKLPIVEKVILFGSRARGDNQERADIDLAILCTSAREEDWQKLLDIADNLDTLLKLDLHRIVSLDGTKPIEQSIAKEGIALYVKSEDKN